VCRQVTTDQYTLQQLAAEAAFKLFSQICNNCNHCQYELFLLILITLQQRRQCGHDFELPQMTSSAAAEKLHDAPCHWKFC